MLYCHCYIPIPSRADIEIRKIGNRYPFKIEIKIETFESWVEVKSVRRYHPYVVQNDIVFRRHLSQCGL